MQVLRSQLVLNTSTLVSGPAQLIRKGIITDVHLIVYVMENT